MPTTTDSRTREDFDRRLSRLAQCNLSPYWKHICNWYRHWLETRDGAPPLWMFTELERGEQKAGIKD